MNETTTKTTPTATTTQVSFAEETRTGNLRECFDRVHVNMSSIVDVLNEVLERLDKIEAAIEAAAPDDVGARRCAED